MRVPFAVLAMAVVGSATRLRLIRPEHNVEKASIPPAPVLDRMPDMPLGVDNLEVVLIPHSHDDTGWQRNVDQYYEEEVRYIYDSVVECLVRNPLRKFIFVETAYFYRWWVEQPMSVQNQVRGLFSAGQLEFVNGGWCMADDASPSTDAWIDQVTLGHRYIYDTLNGTIPKFAWHIDPFGISASYAQWFKEMGYTGWVFNRIDTRLKDLWHNETRLQFKWKPKGSPEDVDPLFAHVLDTHYGAPEIKYRGQDYHFDFEVFGGLGGGSDPGSQIPVSDTDPSPFYNHTAEELAEAFVALARIRAGWYKLGPPWQTVPAGSGVILVPFGDDMKFQNADKQYSNMDRLIKAINANSTNGVTARYGTIKDYMAQINMDAPWPTYSGDFMPLGTNNNIYSSQLDPPGVSEYWTGHYTTRPLMKGLVASADGAKHTAEVAATLHCAGNPTDTELCDEPNADIILARHVTSVLQHHDNIPGTSTPDAAVNLDVRLRASVAASRKVMQAASSLSSDAAVVDEPLDTTKTYHVSLFNSLAHPREEFVEFPLAAGSSAAAAVTDSNGAAVAAEVIPALPAWTAAVNKTFPMASDTPSVIFKATIPPLSSTKYKLSFTRQDRSATANAWECFTPASGAADATIGGDLIAANFSGETGRLSALTVGGKQWAVTQQFAQYHSITTGNPSSNAYQFAPNRSVFPFGEALDSGNTKVRVCTFRSAVVDRAVQTFGVQPKKSGPDCSTQESCHQTCGTNGGFAICNGTYYCCAAQDWECSGVKVCGSYKMCACLKPNATRPFGRMLTETVSLFHGLSSGAALDANSIRTTSEFEMLEKDRELVTRYVTDLDTTESIAYPFDPANVSQLPVFYTDSNGALMMRRVTNRTQWQETSTDVENYPVSDSVAGNYFPLASPGAIRLLGKDGRGFAIVTDRAHGASSLNSGWAEVMLGRRCEEDGGIPVDDTDHIVATNWIIPGPTADVMTEQHRLRAMAAASPLVPLVTVVAEGRETFASASAGSATALPPNVHLLSLDRVGLESSPSDKASRVLLRVRHIYQTGEHSTLSEPATVDLTSLLPSNLDLADVVEVPLNGIGASTGVDNLKAIYLQPMQTRTFEVTIRSV